MKVAVVTDSTASLPEDVVAEWGIVVVPLQVVIGGKAYDEGVDEQASPGFVAEALRDWVPVSTSRAAPAAMAQAYREAAAAGADAIVSIHLSAELSATYESARLAAKESPVPVTTVDSKHVGLATGFAVLAAARRAAEGGTARQVANAARRSLRGSATLFYVDSLDWLRRGGRISAASAIIGTALAVKPLLRVADGRIESLEKVRTSSRALARLADLAVGAAGEESVRVAVMHLAAQEKAASLATQLQSRLAEQVGDEEITVTEVGAVIGAHTGPGLVGIVVAPR